MTISTSDGWQVLVNRLLISAHALASNVLCSRFDGVGVHAVRIAVFTALVVCGNAIGDESSSEDDVASPSIIDPAKFRNSDLNYSELSELSDQLASQVELMLEQLDIDFPAQVPRPQIEITGLADSTNAVVFGEKMREILWRGDVRRLLEVMKTLEIKPEYTRLADVIRFESALEVSSAARILQAIDSNDLSALSDIIEAEEPDLEQYLPDSDSLTPLLYAVTKGNVEATQLLLSAGANPDTQPRARLVSLSPLYQALVDEHDELVKLIGSSGANLDELIGGGHRMSPVAFAVLQDRLDYAQWLIEFGADPNVQDYAGWTALMDALWHEFPSAIDLLIPVSDPRIISADDMTRRHASKNLDLPFLPRGNALFLALRMGTDESPAIANAIRDRAIELEPEYGLSRLELSAQHSRSRLFWFEDQRLQAIDAHRSALAIVDVSSLTGISDGHVITQSMEMLTELHEMLLIEGQTLTDAEYSDVAHITALGGWHAPMHDMLDVIAAGIKVYPVEKLELWAATHGTPERTNWNFDRLNTWVESIDDTVVRDRLFDVLDFYEMNGWVR